MLYSIEALNIAVSQVDNSKEVNKNSWLYNYFIDPLSSKDHIILTAICIALVIIFIGMICDITIAWSISWSFALLNKNLTSKVINQLVYSATAEAVKKQEATVVQRWLTIRQIADFFHNVLANSLGSFFTLSILIWGTYGQNIMAGHTLVSIIVFWLIMLAILSPKALVTSRNYAQMEETVGRNIRSSVSLSDSLKSKTLFKKYITKITPNISGYSRSIFSQGFYGSLLYGILSGIASIGPLVVIIVAIVTTKDTSIGIATGATLYLFASKITSPLSTIAGVMPILQSQRVDFVRFQSLYKNEAERSHEQHIVFDEFQKIDIEDCSYKYDNSKQLSYKGFSILKGQITCLSGNSGAGKTTLLKMFSGRLDNDIKIMLNNTTQVRPTDILEEIAYLPQEPKLAELTIKENLDLYSATDHMSNSYCLDVYNKIIAGLPNKENTFITADVIGLSVGQRKALSVINILSMDKPVIILDEPFANIDANLSNLLWLAIKKEAENKIVLMAMHESKYLSECNVIVNLDKS